jgi:hypothetical protein
MQKDASPAAEIAYRWVVEGAVLAPHPAAARRRCDPPDRRVLDAKALNVGTTVRHCEGGEPQPAWFEQFARRFARSRNRRFLPPEGNVDYLMRLSSSMMP